MVQPHERMTEMVIKSWSDNEGLEELVKQKRFDEIVTGVIRSIKPMNMPIETEKGHVTKMVETFVVALPNGITGYCPVLDFSERTHKSYTRFVGLSYSFVIKNVDLENQIAIVSGKIAEQMGIEKFWNEIEELEKNNLLKEKTYQARITGYNQTAGIIHMTVNGQPAYMYRKEWSWSERDIVDPNNGETIDVKIMLVDKEGKAVRVSRRLAIPDPFIFMDSLKVGEIVAGKIEQVHPIHGIYVQLENGVSLKAGKVRHLEEPEAGDIVTCRVQRLDPLNRKGKVVIISYPQGKRRKKDLGSFLFE